MSGSLPFCSKAERGLGAVEDGVSGPLGAVGGEIQVAPVDPQVVAALGEHGLLARTHPQDRLAVHLVARREHWLVDGVDHEVGARLEVERHGMRSRRRPTPRSIPGT